MWYVFTAETKPKALRTERFASSLSKRTNGLLYGCGPGRCMVVQSTEAQNVHHCRVCSNPNLSSTQIPADSTMGKYVIV